MFSLKSKILITVVAIGLLTTGGVANVANAQNSYMPQQRQQEQMKVTDTQLQEFAKAQVAVRQVQEEFQKKATNITSQDEMKALQQQANKQMIQAIQRTNLSAQEYNQITNAVQTNPELRKKYMNITK